VYVLEFYLSAHVHQTRGKLLHEATVELLSAEDFSLAASIATLNYFICS